MDTSVLRPDPSNSAKSVVAVQTQSADGSNVQSVGGNTTIVSAEFTRPANTDAYAVKDVVSDSVSATTLMTFTDLARIAAGSGYITKARLITDQKTNVAQFRLWLYTINNPTIAADNAAMTLLYANRATRLGYIDFSALATEDATGSDSASALNADVRLAFKCAASVKNIYGVLETLTVFTPASGQKFFVELTAEQN